MNLVKYIVYDDNRITHLLNTWKLEFLTVRIGATGTHSKRILVASGVIRLLCFLQ